MFVLYLQTSILLALSKIVCLGIMHSTRLQDPMYQFGIEAITLPINLLALQYCHIISYMHKEMILHQFHGTFIKSQ